MASAAFNPFEAARALEAAGVERAQAEAIAGAIHQVQYHDQATKEDLAELGRQVRTGIAEFRGELRVAPGGLRSFSSQFRADLASFERRMTIRMYLVGAGLAAWFIAFELFA